jgi:protocatechuate 3,4-dioxygenase alpha subunit
MREGNDHGPAWKEKPVTPQITPSQTVGPFLHLVLPWPDGPFVVPAGTPGAVRITGRLLDGAGMPVPDGLIETWQADADGRFSHPDDPRGRLDGGAVADAAAANGAAQDSPNGFRGFGRCPTDAQGYFEITTVKPGALPAPDGGTEAPHIDVTVLARGLLNRVVTRVYFPDEAEANEADPVLRSVDPARRATLIAAAVPNGLRFDIHLQDSQTGGESSEETVFFSV